MQSNIDLVIVKQSYLLTLTSDEGTLSGVGKLIQRATTLYFMTNFKFQFLLSQNKLSKEVLKSEHNGSINAQLIKVMQR
jgi:hypothetical protein